MNIKNFLLSAVLYGAAALTQCHAAPARPAKVAASTKAKTPAAAKPASTKPAPTKAAVNINAVTRNETKSKVELMLAENEKALLPIVISAKASDATRLVANDLATQLKRISGATFEVKTGDGSAGIVLGKKTEFPIPALDKALEIFNGYDGKEAYAIRTREKRVVLLGATDKGTSHAAYRFLEELGYRHFFPDVVWEVVPSVANLKWNKEITDRPSILSRSIWFEAGSGTEAANEYYRVWKRRNAQAESFVSNAGHNLDAVPHMFPAEFNAHPEYYAQSADGKRLGDDIELTNPAVRKLVVEYARRFFKAKPDADMVSIDPVDTTSHSQSPEAKKTSYSDQIFGVANEVALMLQKEFPGKMVGLLSYNAHWDPPSFPLEPNVHVQMSGLGQGKYTPGERDHIWTTLSQNRGVYDYYSVFLWGFDRLPGSWSNNVYGLQAGLKSQAASGVTAISAESTSNWGLNGRGYYISTKLMWNPDQNLDILLDDFYTKAFGPAAPAMKKYYESIQPDNARFLSKHLVGTAFTHMDEATRLAKDRPDVQARLDFVKLYLHYIYLEWAQNRDGKQGLGAEISSLYGRNADRAIFTFSMASQTWWAGTDWNAAIYKRPFTHEEIEKNFQEGLKYFPVRNDIGKAVEFSTDLVPIDWGASAVPLATSSHQLYQDASKYALYSIKGEPLEFKTWAGGAWGGINRFSLTDAKGVEIIGKNNLAREMTQHKIAVPGPGLYWLNYNDNGSWWGMHVLANIPVTIPLIEATGTNKESMHPMYFYVPKGTKIVEYFYSRTTYQAGGRHKVIDPSGKVLKEVDINGDWVSVPVPAGMDGKLWKLQDASLGRFWFNTMPNYIAASPQALLVPREVAKKDGLTIRTQ